MRSGNLGEHGRNVRPVGGLAGRDDQRRFRPASTGARPAACASCARTADRDRRRHRQRRRDNERPPRSRRTPRPPRPPLREQAPRLLRARDPPRRILRRARAARVQHRPLLRPSASARAPARASPPRPPPPTSAASRRTPSRASRRPAPRCRTRRWPSRRSMHLGRHVRDRAAVDAACSRWRRSPGRSPTAPAGRRPCAACSAASGRGGRSPPRESPPAPTPPRARPRSAPPAAAPPARPIEARRAAIPFSASSITRNARPSACSKSNTRQTFGCWICRASFTSRASRVAHTRWPTSSARTILIATSCRRSRSCARTTTPEPPRPMIFSIAYRPPSTIPCRIGTASTRSGRTSSMSVQLVVVGVGVAVTALGHTFLPVEL